MISLERYNRYISDQQHAARLLMLMPSVALVLSAFAIWVIEPRITGMHANSWVPLFTPMSLALVLGLYALHYFRRLLASLKALPQTLPSAAAYMTRKLRSYSRQYWSLLLALIALSNTLHALLLGTNLSQITAMILMQIGLVILIAMPLYLVTLDCLGTVMGRYGLTRPHSGFRVKLVLLGMVLPMCSGLLLAQYYVAQGGEIGGTVVMAWLMLWSVGVLTTLLTLASLHKSLAPVRALIRHGQLASDIELARVRPQSTDEIGYLVHIFGRLAQRIREQNAYLRAVSEAADESIIQLDEQGKIRHANSAAVRLFGQPLRRLRGMPVNALLPGLTMDVALQNEVSEVREMRGYAGERELTLSVRTTRVTLAGKMMYVCTITEIGERKQAEAQWQAAEQRYRDLVETAQDMIWCLDANGCWSYVNEAAIKLYGCTPEWLIGKPFYSCAEDDHKRQDQWMLKRMGDGEEMVLYVTAHRGFDGVLRYLSFNGRGQRDVDGTVVQYLGSARDITEKRIREQKLYYQAQHDSLTGLYNRNYFCQELERVVARVARSGAECALIYIDLDKFKDVNDSAGHAAGDRLLIEVTAMCRAQLREVDIMGRMGGDEFTILLYDVNEEAALMVGNKLRHAFESYYFQENDTCYTVTGSLGIAMVTGNGVDAEEVMAQADIACNAAKMRGRNQVVLYEASLRDKPYLVDDTGWAGRLRDAVEHDRFSLLYQPIVALDGAQNNSYEIFIRLKHEQGEILPGGFLPAAERFGVMHNVDRWMVRQAIARLAEMNNAVTPALQLSINLSAKALEDAGFVALLRDALNEHQVSPALLTFEISEATVMSRLSLSETFIREVREIGCQVALDDFGSGFSSLAYLRQLPVDKLKIDAGYIQRMGESEIDRAMVQSIAQVARIMGKVTVAESVEDARTLEMLRDMGVDYAQGYYLGRPSPQLPSEALH